MPSARPSASIDAKAFAIADTLASATDRGKAITAAAIAAREGEIFSMLSQLESRFNAVAIAQSEIAAGVT